MKYSLRQDPLLKRCLCQIDLASDPQKRRDMLAASNGCSIIPQLHYNNKFIGDWDTVQDLEDFGELEAALQG